MELPETHNPKKDKIVHVTPHSLAYSDQIIAFLVDIILRGSVASLFIKPKGLLLLLLLLIPLLLLLSLSLLLIHKNNEFSFS